MEENNEELNSKINELHTAFEKSQTDLMEKLEKYIEDDKYEKEFETLRQLCKKIMDLYQLNKKEIEKISLKQKENDTIVEEKLTDFLNNEQFVKNIINDNSKTTKLEARVDNLEKEVIEDRKTNRLEFGKTNKKCDKEIKDLIEQFNEAMQQMKDSLERENREQTEKINEQQQNETKQFENLMSQINDAFVKIQEEIDEHK